LITNLGLVVNGECNISTVRTKDNSVSTFQSTIKLRRLILINKNHIPKWESSLYLL